MTFLRLTDNRLINIDQIVLISPPNTRYRKSNYRIHMSNGTIYTLVDEETMELLRLITIFSTHEEPTDGSEQLLLNFGREINQ